MVGDPGWEARETLKSVLLTQQTLQRERVLKRVSEATGVECKTRVCFVFFETDRVRGRFSPYARQRAVGKERRRRPPIELQLIGPPSSAGTGSPF